MRPDNPEVSGSVATVNESGHIARALSPVNAHGNNTTVGEGPLGVVAAGAGEGAVPGNYGVVEEPPAEVYLGACDRVLFRDGHVEVETQGGIEQTHRRLERG